MTTQRDRLVEIIKNGLDVWDDETEIADAILREMTVVERGKLTVVERGKCNCCCCPHKEEQHWYARPEGE